MWLLLLLVCLPSAACLRCHGMGYEDDANYLTVCKVTITAGKTAADVPTVEWNAEDMECRRDGCISSHNTIHCCCSKEMCNTVSYALAEASETGSLPFYHYYSYPVLAVVLLVQIIALTRVYGSTILRAHSEILPRHLHVSLTEFTASPMLSADELEDLPWSESKEEEEKSAEELVQIKRAVLKGVITYTCEYEGAFPQTPAETQKRLEDYGITENSYFEEIFRAVLRCGPREVAWQAALAIRILREVTELFLKEPNVVRVNPPLAIYADLHGQYSDLWRWLNVNGWPARTRSLFMGDYVDRGRHCTEVYLLLALLKILYPENVTLLRGNHEDGQVNRTYSFFAEVEARFADRAKEVFEAFEDCFAAMPMTGLVGGRVLCLHGGLTPRLPSLADIEAVSRPTSRHLTKDEDFIGILWSDPVDVRNFQPNVARDTCGHGIGYEFGPPQIHKFCKENELSFILRGHQPPMHGYEHFSSQLVTLFSAPDYRREGVVSNLGGSMLIDAEGRMLIVRLSPDGTVRRPRRKLGKGAKYYPSPPMRVGSSESEKKSISTSSELNFFSSAKRKAVGWLSDICRPQRASPPPPQLSVRFVRRTPPPTTAGGNRPDHDDGRLQQPPQLPPSAALVEEVVGYPENPPVAGVPIDRERHEEEPSPTTGGADVRCRRPQLLPSSAVKVSGDPKNRVCQEDEPSPVAGGADARRRQPQLPSSVLEVVGASGQNPLVSGEPQNRVCVTDEMAGRRSSDVLEFRFAPPSLRMVVGASSENPPVPGPQNQRLQEDDEDANRLRGRHQLQLVVHLSSRQVVGASLENPPVSGEPQNRVIPEDSDPPASPSSPAAASPEEQFVTLEDFDGYSTDESLPRETPWPISRYFFFRSNVQRRQSMGSVQEVPSPTEVVVDIATKSGEEMDVDVLANMLGDEFFDEPATTTSPPASSAAAMDTTQQPMSSSSEAVSPLSTGSSDGQVSSDAIQLSPAEPSAEDRSLDRAPPSPLELSSSSSSLFAAPPAPMQEYDNDDDNDWRRADLPPEDDEMEISRDPVETSTSASSSTSSLAVTPPGRVPLLLPRGSPSASSPSSSSSGSSSSSLSSPRKRAASSDDDDDDDIQPKRSRPNPRMPLNHGRDKPPTRRRPLQPRHRVRPPPPPLFVPQPMTTDEAEENLEDFIELIDQEMEYVGDCPEHGNYSQLDHISAIRRDRAVISTLLRKSPYTPSQLLSYKAGLVLSRVSRRLRAARGL